MAANTNDRTNRWLTGDPWRHHDREDEELERVRKGPSCIVYLQRHGYANGDDVRVFGEVLHVAARRVSATVLRARRLSPELKRIPEDLVVRHVLPYLFEDEPVGEGAEDRYNQFRRMNLTEDCVHRSLSCYLALRASSLDTFSNRCAAILAPGQQGPLRCQPSLRRHPRRERREHRWRSIPMPAQIAG